MAGIFDGEGCISMSRENRSDRSVFPVYNIYVSVGNTHLPTLEMFKKHFGGSIRRAHLQQRRKKVYSWVTSTGKAYSFLRTLLPYLRIKHDQAMVACEYLETKKTSKARVTEEDVAIREYYYQRLKQLKED